MFVNGLRKIVDEHPNTVKDNYHVYLNDMGASSLNILFYIFFDVPTWSEELKARHEVLLQVINLAKELGIKLRISYANTACREPAWTAFIITKLHFS